MLTVETPPYLQAEDWFKIEPHDRYNFVGDSERNPKGYYQAAIYVGTGGDISITSHTGSTEIFKSVPSGWFFPVACVRVNSTSTTATNIIGVVSKKQSV